MIRLTGIGKSFAGVRVLRDVSLTLRRGEIHTIMGENGAGKSTLMKIVAGVLRPDAGIMEVDGVARTFGSPLEALRSGVTLIHQEPLSFPDLSVAENVLFAHGLPMQFPGRVDWKAMHRRVGTLLSDLGVTIDPRRRMRGLSIADQQMVELAAALAGKAKVLLMDEPTAALTPGEVDRLFGIVRKLKADGVAVVFVSHRIPEVFDVSDRITVLRDGAFIATQAIANTTPAEIVRLMVGRELSTLSQRDAVRAGDVLLELKGVLRRGSNAAVSLIVRAGEIVSLAGLVGAGRTELAEAVFGLRDVRGGTTYVGGAAVRVRSPADAIRAGIAYVPEDRAHHGLLAPLPVAVNGSLARLSSVATAGMICGRRERALAEGWRDRLAIRLRDVRQPVRELSGGNQQKVVLAKWLETRPKVLIIDEPTRGVDVGAKSEVHRLMVEHAKAGGAVLMISSDLPEVLAMSDRVLVMRGNAIVAEIPGHAATQESIMAFAAGTTVGDPPSLGASNLPLHDSNAAAYSTGDKVATNRKSASGRFREAGVLAFLAVALAVALVTEPRFRSMDALRQVALYIPLILVVGIGQLMVIVSRNIDLSVGSVLGLAAMVTCGWFVGHPSLPLWLAFPLAVAIGAAAGAVNGLMVAFLRVPAIIATLATLTGYRGLIYIWSGGRQVDPDKLPEALLGLTVRGPVLPWIVWIALAIAAATWAFLGHTVRGREIFAVGGNPEAARLRGMRVRGITVQVFAISGGLAGLAGLLFASRFGTVNPNSVGVQMELVTISAVVIGGAAVAGGAGSVLGTLLGCVLLGVINVAMIIHGVEEFWQLVVYGAAILLACVVDAGSGRLTRRPS